MKSSKAITYHAHGKPHEVLQLEERPLPQVRGKQAKVRLLAAVIHPSDMGMIAGSYGRLKELPAVAGREGLGEVIEVGDEVSCVAVGDRVRFPEDEGAWQTACVVSADKLWKIPHDIPVELAAMAFINPPTSWRLLRDGNLQEGEWVIQNAANSAVGQFVIQMARSLKLKTLNVVRNSDYIEPLKKMGADVVVLEDSGYEKKIEELTGGQEIRLALNSVGGESANRLVKSLGFGGQHVTFGGMTGEPIRFPTRALIFQQVSLRGFWLDLWYRQNSRDRIEIMFNRIFSMMQEGELTAPVDKTFKLEAFQEALQANRDSRLGKVLLVP
ncbi:MAG: 2-enoyl thioester reductase domain-containing protein [Opitutales bacterium]|nr:2-enoyl thioester reductase domain-containing protein [Opitutales bacterium]